MLGATHTRWRLARITCKRKRAALQRVQFLQALRREKTMALAPAPSQMNQRRPDERVADNRAWSKYRREQQEWKPVLKPQRPCRVKSLGEKKRRRQRKKEAKSQRNLERLAVEDLAEAPQPNRRRRRKGCEKVLPEALPTGLMKLQ